MQDEEQQREQWLEYAENVRIGLEIVAGTEPASAEEAEFLEELSAILTRMI